MERLRVKVFSKCLVAAFLFVGLSSIANPFCSSLLERVYSSQPQVFKGISPKKAELVVNELNSILNDVLSPSEISHPMTAKQFQTLSEKLLSFANRYQIEIKPMTETVGVFPKGLFEIGVAGFTTDKKNTSAHATFIERHELLHLFHTIEVRAILIDSLHLSADSNPKEIREAEKFLYSLEGPGSNYRQFEKAVTAASSPVVELSSQAKLNENYKRRAKEVIELTAEGLQKGRVHFPNGQSPQDLYAQVISKAPLIVGTSAKDLFLRMPFILFGALYAQNGRNYSLPDTLCGKKLTEPKFRDRVHEILRNLVDCQ